MTRKSYAYRGRPPAAVMAELDADTSAAKRVDTSLSLTTYELDDGSLVEVTPRTVHAHYSHASFCMGMS